MKRRVNISILCHNWRTVSGSRVHTFKFTLDYVRDGCVKTTTHTPAPLKHTGVRNKHTRNILSALAVTYFLKRRGFVAVCGHFHQVVKSLLCWHAANVNPTLFTFVITRVFVVQFPHGVTSRLSKPYEIIKPPSSPASRQKKTTKQKRKRNMFAAEVKWRRVTAKTWRAWVDFRGRMRVRRRPRAPSSGRVRLSWK